MLTTIISFEIAQMQTAMQNIVLNTFCNIITVYMVPIV